MSVFRGLEKLLADVDFVYLTELAAVEAPARFRMSYRKNDRNFCEVGKSLEEIVKRLLAKPRRCLACGVTKEAQKFAIDPATNRRDRKCRDCKLPSPSPKGEEKYR